MGGCVSRPKDLEKTAGPVPAPLPAEDATSSPEKNQAEPVPQVQEEKVGDSKKEEPLLLVEVAEPTSMDQVAECESKPSIPDSKPAAVEEEEEEAEPNPEPKEEKAAAEGTNLVLEVVEEKPKEESLEAAAAVVPSSLSSSLSSSEEEGKKEDAPVVTTTATQKEDQVQQIIS